MDSKGNHGRYVVRIATDVDPKKERGVRGDEWLADSDHLEEARIKARGRVIASNRPMMIVDYVTRAVVSRFDVTADGSQPRELHAFAFRDQRRYFAIEERAEGARWYRLYEPAPAVLLSDSNPPVHLGSIRPEAGWHQCEGADGSEASKEVCNVLLVTMDYAREGRPEMFTRG